MHDYKENRNVEEPLNPHFKQREIQGRLKTFISIIFNERHVTMAQPKKRDRQLCLRRPIDARAVPVETYWPQGQRRNF